MSYADDKEPKTDKQNDGRQKGFFLIRVVRGLKRRKKQ
jgi:hypothetical protein